MRACATFHYFDLIGVWLVDQNSDGPLAQGITCIPPVIKLGGV